MTDEGLNAGHSRRTFIKGVIAAGATVSASAYLFRTTILGQNDASLPGSVERLITLDVNGQQRRVDVLKHETLATTLRYKLGLTGTKIGCDRSECGACTVLIDDVPHYSCSILTHQVRGRAVTTIEGLESPDGKLHPVQQAVWDEAGFHNHSGWRFPSWIDNDHTLITDPVEPLNYYVWTDTVGDDQYGEQWFEDWNMVALRDGEVNRQKTVSAFVSSQTNISDNIRILRMSQPIPAEPEDCLWIPPDAEAGAYSSPSFSPDTAHTSSG